ncbi:hypothetical protein BDY17DRAFT_299636 [Neohortaea acidophila]|uniref:Uncharacterized protein n=1 Tax=Neohortaea acidophila TaxID=245834 RepID=A0A6A6PNW6_9PEZI|nr:uncharacterized protein BDY17DRAFT_299636 [Neohortaea acidophila]KAF2481769.1 hypothetical protein BDY17DRAFT_299636 [Neohortaea acidophila]
MLHGCCADDPEAVDELTLTPGVEDCMTSRISYTTTTTRGSRLDATDWTWHVIQHTLTPPAQEDEWPELVVKRECNAGGMHGVVCIAAIRHTPPAHRCLFDETFEKVQPLPSFRGMQSGFRPSIRRRSMRLPGSRERHARGISDRCKLACMLLP